MSDVGGIIASAIAGGAGAAQDMAKGYIDDERKTTVAQQLSDIEEKRQQRIAQAAEITRRAGKQWDTDYEISSAPRKYEAQAAGERVVGAAKNEVAVEGERAIGPVRASNAGLVADATSDADRRSKAAYANDPNAQAGDRAKARAQHIESAASAAQAALANMEIADRQEARKLIDDLGKIQDDPVLSDDEKDAKVRDLEKRITLVQRKSGKTQPRDPEYDRETVTTESEDPATGAVTKKTVVNQRKPGAKSTQLEEAPRDMAQRKSGQTYSTPRGPAIWRGNGWELVTK